MAIYDNQAGAAPASEPEEVKTEETEVKADTEVKTEDKTAEDADLYVKFRKPYKFEGKTYDGLDMSGLEDLSGQDMRNIESMAARFGSLEENVNPMRETSVSYALAAAMQVTGQPMEFFNRLPFRDMLLVKYTFEGFMFAED